MRLTGGELPEIKHVAYSNFCDIGWKVDEARGGWCMVAVLDNLVKGAAGQAVQNLNIVLGLDERTGLLVNGCCSARPEAAAASSSSSGGELLEQPAGRAACRRGIAALAARSALVVVHGGGKEIDAALATAGIPKQQVDGLRVTDARDARRGRLGAGRRNQHAARGRAFARPAASRSGSPARMRRWSR